MVMFALQLLFLPDLTSRVGRESWADIYGGGMGERVNGGNIIAGKVLFWHYFVELKVQASASRQKSFEHLHKLVQAVIAQNLPCQQAMSNNQQDISLFCSTSLSS